jgi:hypothetical protein
MTPYPSCWKREALLCLYPCPGSLFGFVQYGTAQHSRAQQSGAHERISLAPVSPSRRWLVHDLSPSLPLPLVFWYIPPFYQRCFATDWMLDRHVFVTQGLGRREREEKRREEKGGETFRHSDSSP